MKILYVLERYPELSQTFVSAEIRGLIELGCEVEVVALSSGQGGEAPVEAVYASGASPTKRIGSAILTALLRPSAAWRQLIDERSWPPPAATGKLRGFARIAPWVALARTADHVHAHFATEAADIGRLLARASGARFSFTAHAADAYGEKAPLAVNIAAASFVRASAGHVARRLIDAAPTPSGKVVDVPVAINDDRFLNPGVYAGGGPVVAVGRLVPKKGFDDLILASARSAEALGRREVLIAGEGPERQRLEELISETGAPVRLLGPLPNSEIPGLLATASLFAAPSKVAQDGDRDGRPAAIAEAMTAGLPVLSTTLPGIPDLVDSGQGILVRPDDPAALAAGLSGMLGRPAAEREAMGRAASKQALAIHGRRAVAMRMLDLFAGRGNGVGARGTP